MHPYILTNSCTYIADFMLCKPQPHAAGNTYAPIHTNTLMHAPIILTYSYTYLADFMQRGPQPHVAGREAALLPRVG